MFENIKVTIIDDFKPRELYRIYIAGPLTPTGSREDTGNPAVEYLYNMRDMMKTWDILVRNGFAPFNPALDFQQFFINNYPEGTMYRQSMAWLEVCDAVLVIGDWEKSSGTKAELARAEELGIPIYHSISGLIFTKLMNKEIKRG